MGVQAFVQALVLVGLGTAFFAVATLVCMFVWNWKLALLSVSVLPVVFAFVALSARRITSRPCPVESANTPTVLYLCMPESSECDKGKVP